MILNITQEVIDIAKDRRSRTNIFECLFATAAQLQFPDQADTIFCGVHDMTIGKQVYQIPQAGSDMIIDYGNHRDDLLKPAEFELVPQTDEETDE